MFLFEGFSQFFLQFFRKLKMYHFLHAISKKKVLIIFFFAICFYTMPMDIGTYVICLISL